MSTTDDTDPADELLAAADEDLLRYLRAGGIASRADVRDLLRMHDRLAAALAAIDALHGNSIDPSECMECDHDRSTKGTEPRAYPCLTKAIANGFAPNAAAPADA